MRYVLGIDGGGTKTQPLIADEEGHVQGRAWGDHPTTTMWESKKPKQAPSKPLWFHPWKPYNRPYNFGKQTLILEMSF